MTHRKGHDGRLPLGSLSSEGCQQAPASILSQAQRSSCLRRVRHSCCAAPSLFLLFCLFVFVCSRLSFLLLPLSSFSSLFVPHGVATGEARRRDERDSERDPGTGSVPPLPRPLPFQFFQVYFFLFYPTAPTAPTAPTVRYGKPTTLPYGTENRTAPTALPPYRTVRKTYRSYGTVRYGYGTETVQVRYGTVRDRIFFSTYFSQFFTVSGYPDVFSD